MSVSDIPEVFGDNKRLMLLYPAVAYGYLYHISGALWLAGLTVVSLVSPAYDFSLFYYHGIEDFREYGGWRPKRVSLIGALLYIPLGLLHILALCVLGWYMDHTDYILVGIFFTGIFIAMIVIIGWKHQQLANEIDEVSGSPYSGSN